MFSSHPYSLFIKFFTLACQYNIYSQSLFSWNSITILTVYMLHHHSGAKPDHVVKNPDCHRPHIYSSKYLLFDEILQIQMYVIRMKKQRTIQILLSSNMIITITYFSRPPYLASCLSPYYTSWVCESTTAFHDLWFYWHEIQCCSIIIFLFIKSPT